MYQSLQNIMNNDTQTQRRIKGGGRVVRGGPFPTCYMSYMRIFSAFSIWVADNEPRKENLEILNSGPKI